MSDLVIAWEKASGGFSFFFLFGSLGFRNVLSLGLRGYSPFYIVDALMVSL